MLSEGRCRGVGVSVSVVVDCVGVGGGGDDFLGWLFGSVGVWNFCSVPFFIFGPIKCFDFAGEFHGANRNRSSQL